MSTIGILLHHNDTAFAGGHYLVNHLIRHWSRYHSIQVLKGTGRSPPLDLLVPHVDLTRLPPDYDAFMDMYPNVLNRGVKDISKRRISSQLLTDEPAYDGPVMVKPDLNCAGAPEVGRSLPFPLLSRAAHALWRLLTRPERGYRVYPSPQAVPLRYRQDPRFVLEKFLPEVVDGVYYVRVYSFLGDRHVNSRVGSSEPIVKARNIISRELVEPHPDIVTLREHLGFDYGKFDYVVRGTRAILLDANRTPGNSPFSLANTATLEAGINHFL